ncbi:MAG TPA: hypothetical protein VF666_06075 [Pyrinomonadaceae bacterium]
MEASKSVTGRARAASTDEVTAAIRASLAESWLPRLYVERILPLRTRAHNLPSISVARGGAQVEIQHTLLGVELKVGRRRLSCPDLATARYLAVFARAGCTNVAVPYDITKISPLADELESAWQRMLLLVEHEAEDRSSAFRSRVLRTLVGEIRQEIAEAGAGTQVPQFNQNTKQRRQSV